MEFLSALQAQLLAPKYFGWLFQGWLMTLWMSALVAVAATLLGLVLAASRSSSHRAVAWGAAAYVSVFRNTPLLVQLFFWYFGAPSLLPEATREWLYSGQPISLGGWVLFHWPSFEFVAAWLALVLYSTAYIGEEICSGIRGVAPNQYTSASALGFTRLQLLRYIVLPQALRIAMPPLLGQYMNTIKNTSLAMAVGLVELSYTSRQVEAETFKTFQAFGFATAFYIVTIVLVDRLGQRLVRSGPGRASARGAGARA